MNKKYKQKLKAMDDNDYDDGDVHPYTYTSVNFY